VALFWTLTCLGFLRGILCAVFFVGVQELSAATLQLVCPCCSFYCAQCRSTHKTP